MNHEKTHLKEKTVKKENDDATPKVNRKSFRGGVNEHNNTNGPPCFICGAVCKDSANYRNHILSHYYRSFDDHVPARKPFTCPVCQKESRDKITLIRWETFSSENLIFQHLTFFCLQAFWIWTQENLWAHRPHSWELHSSWIRIIITKKDSIHSSSQACCIQQFCCKRITAWQRDKW